MTRQEFLARSGVVTETLEVWLEQRWLIPDETANFSDREVARARLILDLKGDLGVNDEGIDVILHLLDQLHGVRRILAQLRDDVGRDA
ncbi:MAG: chaperone modulator CbpM [Caulobacteraceae bacterium]|jgi:chaperone modulatory protein CbpM